MIVDEVLGGINYKASDDFQKGPLLGMARSILANNDGAACIVAMRGRVQEGGKVSPTLMAGEQDICRIEKADFVIGGLQEHQTPRTDGISPSLTAAMGMGGGQTPLINESTYRIRKLTPKECWRLMDFTDEDFEKAEKVNSNSQLYKQAGNSIVKNVLMAIFGQMIPGKENIYKER